MTEREHLQAELRQSESQYAWAKIHANPVAAKYAAEDMARLNHLLWLVQQQETEERHG